MEIHAGAVAPYEHAVRVTSEAFNLSTASAAVILVRRENGDEVEWAATVSEAAAGSVLVTHAYEDGDVPDVGTLQCVAEVTTDDGEIVSIGYSLNVIDPFAG
jgi:hypothetical protein